MSTHIDDARSVAQPAPPVEVVAIVAAQQGGMVTYRVVVNDRTTLDEVLPAGLDGWSVEFFERQVFEDGALFLAEVLAQAGWVTLDQVLAHVACAHGAGRAARRRQERGQ
jgi:hypothetical protein